MIYPLKNSFHITCTLVLCFVLNLTLSSPAGALDSWSFGVTPQVLMAKYNDSTLRDTMAAFGLFAKADYLEKGGVTVGYNFTAVAGKAENPDIEETSWYASGRYVQYSDALAGKLGVRLDGYAIKDRTKTKLPANNDGMGQNQGHGGSVVNTLTDEAGVIYGQLDYMNYGDRFYADIGYAQSNYDYELNNPPYRNNKVRQITPTVGLALNDRYDYLQARAYFIRLEHGDNTDGLKQSNALEFKWLHWFKPEAILNTHSSFIKLLAGKRLFPVDPDAAAAYSIADLQTSSVSAGLDWKIGEQGKLSLLVGYDRYENLVIKNKYSTRFLFSSFTLNW